jgi:hypothetical protein
MPFQGVQKDKALHQYVWAIHCNATRDENPEAEGSTPLHQLLLEQALGGWLPKAQQVQGRLYPQAQLPPSCIQKELTDR